MISLWSSRLSLAEFYISLRKLLDAKSWGAVGAKRASSTKVLALPSMPCVRKVRLQMIVIVACWCYKWHILNVSRINLCAAHIEDFESSVAVLQDSNRWTFSRSSALFIHILGHRQRVLCSRLLMKWFIIKVRGLQGRTLAAILFGGWSLACET